MGVIAKECGDPQLALLVARLVEGAPMQGGAAWKLIQKVMVSTVFPVLCSLADNKHALMYLAILSELFVLCLHVARFHPLCSGVQLLSLMAGK